MNCNILIAGSAHLDIVANYNEKTKDDVHKVGEILIGVGGVAYNIAANLSNNNCKVHLYSVVKKDSFSGRLIREALHQKDISTEYLFEEDGNVGESGFVAHMHDGVLRSAVAATMVDIVSLNIKLYDAIKDADIIVLDCNLGGWQIQQILTAVDGQKPIFISSVSESKVGNAIGHVVKGRENCYKVFSLNNAEVSKSFGEWENINEKNGIQSLCGYFSSEYVVITNGENGFSVFNKDGIRENFPAPNVPNRKSELGAGDALLSAVIAYYCTHTNLDNWRAIRVMIEDFVKKVLYAPLATPDAHKPIDHKVVMHKERKQKEKLVAVMLPFNLEKTYSAIKTACYKLNIDCKKGDDIWENSAFMKDIIELIRNSTVVIADLSGKNTNVFYEIGIAHAMDKLVIPIAQSLNDVPADLMSLKVLQYYPNNEGYRQLAKELETRISEILNKDLFDEFHFF